MCASISFKLKKIVSDSWKKHVKEFIFSVFKEPNGRSSTLKMCASISFKLKKIVSDSWQKHVKEFVFSVFKRFKPAALLKRNCDKGICYRFWPQIYLDTFRLRCFLDWLFFRNTFSDCLPNKHHERFFSVKFFLKGKFIWKEAKKPW